MLRRSTSFDTSPMPMNTAMNRPNIDDRGQAEVLDDLDVLPRRELAEQVRRADQQDREQHQVVEHLVADRFAEHVDRDPANRRAPASCVSRPRAPSLASRHLLHEEVLERLAERVERHQRARRRRSARASTRSGGGSSGSSSA